MKHITLEKIFLYLATASFVASLLRIALHWLRGLPLLLLICPYDQNNPSGFWRIYGAFEDTIAYISVSLEKFARKGDSSKMLIIPDTKQAVGDALQNLGSEPPKE